MNELVIGDKTYISSKRAAEVTGYAKDYVGQLCREGHVEAKMVGRSWYVLESSIRNHRFGKPEEKITEESVEEADHKGLPTTWEPSRYVPEVLPSMPIVVARKETSPHVEGAHDETISEMQNAWKEWFESRNEGPSEAPDGDSSQEGEVSEPEEASTHTPNVEESVPIVLHKLPEPEIEVPIRPITPPGRPVAREALTPAPIAVQRSYKPRRQRTSMVTIALLMVVAGFAVAVGLVGSGLTDTYAMNNPVLKFLGGASTINK